MTENTAKIIDFATSTLESLAKEFAEYNRIESEAKKQKEAIKAQILERIGEAQETTAGMFVIKNTTYAESRLDSKALKAELPEIAARYTKTSERTRFSVTL